MELIKELARIIFSIGLVLIGLKLLLGTDQTVQKVGVGLISTVAGYWLDNYYGKKRT